METQTDTPAFAAPFFDDMYEFQKRTLLEKGIGKQVIVKAFDASMSNQQAILRELIVSEDGCDAVTVEFSNKIPEFAGTRTIRLPDIVAIEFDKSDLGL